LKKQIGLAAIVFSILLLVIFLDKIISFIINVQWFSEVGYLTVYFTKIIATLKLMVPLFIIFFLGIWLYYRSIRKSILQMRKIVDVNTSKRKLEKKIFFWVNSLIYFILSYGIAGNYWYRILQFSNSTDFNVKDPIFGIDVSFYVFRLPLIQSLYGAVIGFLIFLVMITLITYFLLNATDSLSSFDIRNPLANMKAAKSNFTRFAGKQLAIISAILLLMVSAGYIIKAFSLLYSPKGLAFGASYTDTKVSLLFYKIIAIGALIAAIVVFVSILASKIKPIIISIIGIILLVILEGVASGLVETLVVKSNQASFEETYVNYNIEYTRKAFNIDGIEENKFDVKDNLVKEDINKNKDILDNIRINSFRPSLDFYNQVQFLRYYYSFNDIDIDRYNIDGKYTQVFVAPREVNADTIEPSTWQNKHLVYTHGYGLVMSKVNSVTPEGQPNFVIRDIPLENKTGINVKNPRIYFGEKTNDYVVVNTDIDEVDYPLGSDNMKSKYDGKAGISMNLINRLLFAMNKRDMNFLLSRDINSNSKILLNRNILERVKKITPFLIYDDDPYIVIDNGRLYWIIDAYTVSDRYPYSQPYGNINYIRNSAKVVIDAFDGKTDFYIVDKNDPVIVSYSKIFKGLFKEPEEVPPGIREHFRYPEGIFDIQSNVLGRYHMTNTRVFLTGEDQWEVSESQRQVEQEKQVNEAFYVVMKLPGQKSQEMVLLQYFNVKEKENMSAMLAARMDAENYGKMVLYKFPINQTVYSPHLFEKKRNQDPVISKEISLLDSKGSRVEYGDIVIVPINNSLLYAQPMYLISEGKNSIPEVKWIFVQYGEKIVAAESIEKALEMLFNISENKAQTPGTGVPAGSSTQWAKQARDLYDKAIEAQKAGDWTKYGEYINKLGEMLKDLSK
jgi:uncharacterized protein